MRRKMRNTLKFNKSSVLIGVILATLIISFTIGFSLMMLQQDTRNRYRRMKFLQGRYLSEGALNIAKGDVMSQFASVNILADQSIAIEDHYDIVINRFTGNDRRIPATTAKGDIDWRDSSIQNLAFWDFVEEKTVDNDDIDLGNDAWNVPGQDGFGDTRVYITQAATDGSSLIRRAQGSYTLTLTAVSDVAGVENIVSSTFQHNLGTPSLFNFLLLGSSISDCSICHVRLWGDIGQVNPEDPIQTEFDYNQWNGGRKKTQIYGSVYTNGDVYRDSFQGNDPFEKHLHDEGQSGVYDGWEVKDRMRIHARNGSELQEEYRNDNPSVAEEANPYRDIDPNTSNLPASWPSVKENLMNWFEPKAILKETDGVSELSVEPRDNNLRNVTYVRDDASTVQIGNSSNYQEYAIDRVFPRDVPFKASGTNSNRDTGLHPFDDLDGDTIPNILDANIDDPVDTDPTSYPESKRGSTDPADAAYRVTHPDLASYFQTDPNTGDTVFTLGRPTPAAGNSWDTSDAAIDPAVINAFVQNNLDKVSDIYEADPNGNDFYWNADINGIATNMENLVNNQFAATPGETPGVIRGVFPNDSTDGDGNPIYGSDASRNLLIRGASYNPIYTKGSVVIRGDAVVTGTVQSGTDPSTGEKQHGQIITHRNIFIPTDLEYKDQPNWDDPDINNGDQLGLLAGGNIMIGNYIQQSIWTQKAGEKTGKSNPARPGNDDPDNYYQGIMPFVWGNMVDPNDENLYKWYWGRDGRAGKKFNHMINPIYVMDGEDGGTWENGLWITENAGNTVDDRFKGDKEQIQIGGGLDTSSDHFNPNRKHQNFNGDTHGYTNKDSKTHFKDFYISTPGLLPLGAERIPFLPSGRYGTYSGSWFDSEDLKMLTQIPKFNGDISSGDFKGTLGEETNADSRWIKNVQGILYSDNGVIGGSLLRGDATDPDNQQALQFYGTVIGRDIQLMVAGVDEDRDTRFTNEIGALYYDKRLRQAVNPLDFPFEERFEGGEMMINGIPEIVDGSRDNWRPYRLTDEYYEYFEN